MIVVGMELEEDSFVKMFIGYAMLERSTVIDADSNDANCVLQSKLTCDWGNGCLRIALNTTVFGRGRVSKR